MATAKDIDRLKNAIARVGGLLTRADLHRAIGVSPQRVHQLSRTRDFPPPVWTSTEGRDLWTAAEIAAWDESRITRSPTT